MMQTLNQILIKSTPFHEKIWKASAEFKVNFFVTLLICEPKLESYVSSYTRYLKMWGIFVFLNFRKLQKIGFSDFCKSDKNVYISVH